MSASETPAPDLRRLADQLIRRIVVENTIIRDDQSRVQGIVEEAATNLRVSFATLHRLISEEKPNAQTAAEITGEFQKIATTLQFEDIVTQIINQQLARSETLLTILLGMRQELNRQVPSINTIRSQLARFDGQQSGSDSVRQQSLASGDIEIF